jgi:hypothetical protein
VTCGNDATVATAAACRGSYCDDMKLWCDALPPGFVWQPQYQSWWTFYTSEEWNPASCDAGAVIDGVKATGSYSDNVSIHCKPVSFPVQGSNCGWSQWFSEEQGQLNFKLNVGSYLGSVALRLRCSNSYCDNMSFYLCEPKCRSNADCFGICNANGVCTVG